MTPSTATSTRRRAIVAIASAAFTLALVAGCTASPDPDTGGGSTDGRGDTFTYARSAPGSLDPAEAIYGQPGVYINLAYANLIEIDDEGNLVPGLAESWQYDDEANTKFTIVLKPDLLFANGEAVDADAVVASLEYVQTGNATGPVAISSATFTAVDDLTIEVQTAEPNPALPDLLSSAFLAGAIIAPEGLEDPERLAEETFGAGPYVLNVEESTPGATYIYDANPNYYDQSQIHWDHFVMQAIGQAAAQLQALQAGQVDLVATYDYQMGVTAAAGGLQVYSEHGQGWDGIHLMDHAGALAPALADVRVRQALNYAVDRDTIAESIFGSVGHPTAGVSMPDWPGYSEETETAYEYDPDRARELLAEAGYADGFTFAVTYQGNGSATDRMVQAVAQNFADVGVTMELRPATNFGELFGNIFSKEVPALELTVSTYNPWIMWHQQWIDGPPAIFNDLSPELRALFDTAASAPVDEADDLWREANDAIVEQAWAVPVVRWNTQYLVAADIEGMVTNPRNGLPNYLSFRPAD